ncbi:MAG: hypothetical protein WD048_11025 [Chitinophagales bacterium]
MIERILGRACSLLIVFAILLPVFDYPGNEILLGLFFACAFLLNLHYMRISQVSIYTLVMGLYAISFLAQIAGFYSAYHFPLVINLFIAAHALFGILLFWTSRVLHKKIGGDSIYVSVTAVVLLLHVVILLFANEKWMALGTNLYYILLGLIATIKIKTEIDKALIPAEQKILNLILLVIAYPISNLVISTIQNF